MMNKLPNLCLAMIVKNIDYFDMCSLFYVPGFPIKLNRKEVQSYVLMNKYGLKTDDMNIRQIEEALILNSVKFCEWIKVHHAKFNIEMIYRERFNVICRYIPKMKALSDLKTEVLFKRLENIKYLHIRNLVCININTECNCETHKIWNYFYGPGEETKLITMDSYKNVVFPKINCNIFDSLTKQNPIENVTVFLHSWSNKVANELKETFRFLWVRISLQDRLMIWDKTNICIKKRIFEYLDDTNHRFQLLIDMEKDENKKDKFYKMYMSGKCDEYITECLNKSYNNLCEFI